jgi:hypothetical protein
MNKLSGGERNLLRYYAETERILRGAERGAAHQHLLRMGYIEERPVNLQDSVVVVTQAGRKALGFRSKTDSDWLPEVFTEIAATPDFMRSA